MILTCPSCAARFVVDPRAIGSAGRKVRCGKCKNEWVATAPLITLPADVQPVHASSTLPPVRGASLPVPVKAPSDVPVWRSAAFGAVAALLIALPILTLRFSPYLAANAKAPAKEDTINGIALDGMPITRLRQQEGRPVLDIEGALINRSGKLQKAPILKARAKNARGQVVREWTIPLKATQLEVGQRLPFTFSTPLADQGVEDISFHLL